MSLGMRDVDVDREEVDDPEISSLLRISPGAIGSTAGASPNSVVSKASLQEVSFWRKDTIGREDVRHSVHRHSATDEPPVLQPANLELMKRASSEHHRQRMDVSCRPVAEELGKRTEREAYLQEMDRLMMEIQETRERLQNQMKTGGPPTTAFKRFSPTSLVSDEPYYNWGRRGSSGGPLEADGRRPRPKTPESFGNVRASIDKSEDRGVARRAPTDVGVVMQSSASADACRDTNRARILSHRGTDAAADRRVSDSGAQCGARRRVTEEDHHGGERHPEREMQGF